MLCASMPRAWRCLGHNQREHAPCKYGLCKQMRGASIVGSTIARANVLCARILSVSANQVWSNKAPCLSILFANVWQDVTGHTNSCVVITSAKGQQLCVSAVWLLCGSISTNYKIYTLKVPDISEPQTSRQCKTVLFSSGNITSFRWDGNKMSVRDASHWLRVLSTINDIYIYINAPAT